MFTLLCFLYCPTCFDFHLTVDALRHRLRIRIRNLAALECMLRFFFFVLLFLRRGESSLLLLLFVVFGVDLIKMPDATRGIDFALVFGP